MTTSGIRVSYDERTTGAAHRARVPYPQPDEDD